MSVAQNRRWRPLASADELSGAPPDRSCRRARCRTRCGWRRRSAEVDAEGTTAGEL